MRKTTKSPSEKIVKDIKRATRKQYSSEEKIRIALDGLRGEDRIAQLCRREGKSQGLYCKWSKDFMEAVKRRLAPPHADECLKFGEGHFDRVKIGAAGR